ncbi:hypothetical protein, conserved [Babesia bigemina]|uniref:C3H1-type domain-containing protein n=1 Tax=Babesia bigemina TaxID=5866 RepID=A0A061BJN7_BABBI|nr:hypothetical protein, conserved [Babesia bigemina]CDR71715.1 hypothetical protein, conserved [Babesia bigemina]|eukprot:XP_012770661.1 hypothetical protein, conserved [Babesia bigemina]
MGFLSGVLGAVKNTQTYNVGKNTLQNLVSNEINNHLCSGHEGFKRLFEKLPKEIEKYNREVQESNKRVRNVITTMNKRMETRKNKVSQILTHNAAADTFENVKSAETSVISELAEVIHYVEIFLTDMNSADKNILDLNSNCKTNVNSAKDNIFYESTRLHRLSDKASNDLKDMNKKITDVLTILQMTVNEEISKRVTELVSTLKGLVGEIKRKLELINVLLKKYINTITRWMLRTETHIQSLRKQHVEKVIQLADGGDGSWRKEITIRAEELKNAKKKLEDYIDNDIKPTLTRLVTEALGKVKDMDAALKGDLKRVKDAVQGKVEEIKTAIEVLGRKFTDVDGVAAPTNAYEIMKHFQLNVTTIKDNVGHDNTPGKSNAGSIDFNWDSLKRQLNWDVEGLTGNSGKLKKIVDGIKKYAEGFENGKFITVLTEWVKEIVEEDEGVISSKITNYSLLIKGNGVLNATKNNVRAAIKAKLPERINTGIKAAAVAVQLRNATVHNIGDLFQKFVTQVGSELIGDAGISILGTAAQEIEKSSELGLAGVQSRHRPNLTDAVASIARSIVNNFKRIAAEVKRFATDTQIQNLSTAIEQIEDIGTQFDEEDDTKDDHDIDHGAKINKALKAVKPVIKTLHDSLDQALQVTSASGGLTNDSNAAAVDTAIRGVTEELKKHFPADSDSKVTLDKDATFVEYNGFVNQAPEKLSSLSNPDFDTIKAAGTLPAAIGDIGSTALNITVKNTTDVLETFSKEMTDNLTKLMTKIYETSKDMNEYLNALKDGSVGKELKGIRDKLSDLQSDKLVNAIESADSLIKYADDEKNRLINNLQHYVTCQVDIAKNSLTTAARRNYVTSVKQLLTAFADKVGQELAPLPGEIERDLRIGFKGLMRVMGGVSSVNGEPVAASGGINTGAKSLLEKINEVVQPAKPSASMKDTFTKLSEAFNTYFNPIHTYVNAQINSENASDPQALRDITADNVQLLGTVNSNFNNLLEHLKKDINPPRTYIFDHTYTNLLSTLSTSLHLLSPSLFANPRHPELLDAVRAGLQGFVEEMGRVYVNGYDGHKEKVDMNELLDNKDKLTDNGRNLSKACMTIIMILNNDFLNLLERCSAAKFQTIYASSGKNNNVLGDFLSSCGYKVSKSYNTQEGELKNKSDRAGQAVYMSIMTKKIDNAEKVGSLKKWKEEKNAQYLVTANYNRKVEEITVFDIVDFLYDSLNLYNDVCHLSALTSTKKPCSVYEMLLWLSGLPHHHAYYAMRDVAILEVIETINKVDNKKEGKQDGATDEDTITVTELKTDSVFLEAYPRKVTYESMRTVVTHICSEAYDLLINIAGHGDEFTTYASDFSNNAMKFHYPASREDCLDMLLDILRRVLPTLQFLLNQCKLSTKHGGWKACKYGKDMPSAKLPCKQHPTDEATGQPARQATSQPNTQPKCQPTCEPNCQPTSPLMSYLNDCLPGHLPHQLTKIGCKYECSTCLSTAKKGMPCLTPLGFREFSGSIKTGDDLCEVLSRFFSNDLMWSLFCLSPTPPKTLPEHFDFALSLVNGISAETNAHSVVLQTLQYAFEESIGEQSIMLYAEKSDFVYALKQAYGSPYPEHGQCTDAHLRNLTAYDSCKQKTNRELECAPYLSALCRQSYRHLPKNHCNLYLSWAIYLPWDFWRLLQNLYNDFCNILCADWGCRSCLRGDKCKRGKHGVIDKDTPTATCQCTSMVTCKGVSPTLYQYGFRFENPSSLNHHTYPNKCADFCTQLNKLLNSKYFTDLFDTCDKFLFTIRAPFIWLNVALWLLSFLYLLHIMVIRLDLLHIKSHLHSPSSHRIAAQSLLAAARVNKLGKVFYLQP